MTNKTLPKSLHTVTALVNLASHLRDGRPVTHCGHCQYVSEAAVILRLVDKVDNHGLIAKAVAVLDKKQGN